ncbi:hypothetical protein PAXRUDRAFT_19861 [Paxillus rubicundulus Ve08.2h10]|uniref:Uncharacterized protein n=1 Tax=Paxillus rubicundulus Ve08.2h10 TaxID=930991 RepID=A0A0D0D3G1_9AGAM|nr:hypothetical protein PAXRUDRAFT_19861 [Paxillus rubicundulus Ve08.2h10]
MSHQPVRICSFDRIDVFKYITILAPSHQHISDAKHLFKIRVSPELPPRDAHKKPSPAIFNTALIVEDLEQFTGTGVAAEWYSSPVNFHLGGRLHAEASIPTVSPFFSGTLITLLFPLSTSKLCTTGIVALYAMSYYVGESLVQVQKSVPALGNVHGQHGWVVRGVEVHTRLERVVVVGGPDNLLILTSGTT